MVTGLRLENGGFVVAPGGPRLAKFGVRAVLAGALRHQVGGGDAVAVGRLEPAVAARGVTWESEKRMTDEQHRELSQ